MRALHFWARAFVVLFTIVNTCSLVADTMIIMIIMILIIIISILVVILVVAFWNFHKHLFFTSSAPSFSMHRQMCAQFFSVCSFGLITINEHCTFIVALIMTNMLAIFLLIKCVHSMFDSNYVCVCDAKPAFLSACCFVRSLLFMAVPVLSWCWYLLRFLDYVCWCFWHIYIYNVLEYVQFKSNWICRCSLGAPWQPWSTCCNIDSREMGTWRKRRLFSCSWSLLCMPLL